MRKETFNPCQREKKNQFCRLFGQIKKKSCRTEENECGKTKEKPPCVNGGGHLVSKADTTVILTCSEGDEGRGTEPNSFRCLFVSFASWLVECCICCLWTQHQCEINLPASSSDTRAEDPSHILQSTFTSQIMSKWSPKYTNKNKKTLLHMFHIMVLFHFEILVLFSLCLNLTSLHEYKKLTLIVTLGVEQVKVCAET